MPLGKQSTKTDSKKEAADSRLQLPHSSRKVYRWGGVGGGGQVVRPLGACHCSRYCGAFVLILDKRKTSQSRSKQTKRQQAAKQRQVQQQHTRRTHTHTHILCVCIQWENANLDLAHILNSFFIRTSSIHLRDLQTKVRDKRKLHSGT